MASNAKELIEMVHQQKDRFTKLDTANGHLLDFAQECLFARQHQEIRGGLT